eukprot:36551-Rhodomonas_salina.1
MLIFFLCFLLFPTAAKSQPKKPPAASDNSSSRCASPAASEPRKGGCKAPGTVAGTQTDRRVPRA